MALKNQNAVVTGASSGIGRAIVRRLAEQAAAVCLVGRKSETLQTVADTAKVAAARVMTYQADLDSDKDIRGLSTYLQREFRHIDILVHSAGRIALGRIDTAPVEDLDGQYRTNVRAPFVLTQALLPLVKAGRGQIVFINSTLGLTGKAQAGQYAATKHALKALADSLRDEVNADGVRVLSVFVGRTATPMQEAIHRIEHREYRPELLLPAEDVASIVIDALSLSGSSEVTEIRIRPAIKSY